MGRLQAIAGFQRTRSSGTLLALCAGGRGAGLCRNDPGYDAPARQSAETHEQAAPLDSEWAPDLGAVFWPIRGVVAGAVVLLAAAVTRRLHDTGRAGWWAALPLVLLAAATATFPSVMEQMMTQAENAPMGLFYLTFGLGMLYNLSLLVLIVFLCLKGTVGPNRYGPQPD